MTDQAGNQDTQRLIEQMREIFARISDEERNDLHKQIMEGYCPTCAHVVSDGPCYYCWDSRCED